MAEQATIARPYARAAFEYAQAQGQLAQWSDALALAASVVSDASVAPLLGNPRVMPAQIVDLIADVAGGKLSTEVRNFIATLAGNRRLAYLPHIAAMYEVLRADVENQADVQVVSAVALDTNQQQRLAAALKTRLKRDVRLHLSVDASLVGGAVVRYGDLVIDGSLKARLERLTAAITH